MVTPSSTSRLEPLGRLAKAGLITEILVEYVPSLRLLGRPDVVGMVQAARQVPATKPRVPPIQEHAQARRLGRAVEKTLRVLPTDSRCLIRSLVLTRLLARRGISNTLVIGVRKDPEFQAHAWVEHEGEPVLPAGEFSRLTEL